ncbi:hypothetical protein [Streptomyces sp. MI02-7b]|uniref:hypothetical protein n=1 Tax=Streptomyces sp. MI02-7b TaxID=462941 RepID=UPI0029A3A97D|nr:hypothetical protein [Streptomyces sp. MI02-7b]MDX3078381.1 hypothetical protein [Streptomyces sp. MI02-7b]
MTTTATTTPAAPTPPTQDRPQDNLRRILLDGIRLRVGERRVDELLAAGTLAGPIAVLMLDIDGTAAIRAKGIDAKIELVLACRDRVSTVLPDDAVVVDSGTRDETYVILTGAAAVSAADLAERVRACVEDQPFALSCFAQSQPVTLSVGYVVRDHLGAAAELMALGREAQHVAKQVRNCVRTTTPELVTSTFAAPTGLVRAAEANGLRPADAVAAGIRFVEQKYTGIRHWAVDQTDAAAGVDPGPALVDVADVDAGEAAFFTRLVRSAVFEALVAHHQKLGPVTVTRVDAPVGLDFLASAQYLPGEWFVARRAERVDHQDRGPVELVHAARGGADRSTEVRFSAFPGDHALLDKLCATRGIPRDVLLAEALQLGTDLVVCPSRLTEESTS